MDEFLSLKRLQLNILLDGTQWRALLGDFCDKEWLETLHFCTSE